MADAVGMGTVPRDIVREWVGTISDEVLDFYTHISDPASHEAMRRLAASNGHSSGGTAELCCPHCGHHFSALSAQTQGGEP